MITNTPNATYWNPGPTVTAQPDRYFWARIDGRNTMFVLHADHSICIASSQPEVVENIQEVLAELQFLAA